MKDQVTILSNDLFGQVRVVLQDGEPLFCLADVCKSLDLHANVVKQRLTDDVCSTYPIVDQLGREQVANFVNEDGLYDVILDSRKPEAKQFRKWITSEVLPSIRKSGGYMVARENETPEQLMARALQVANETLQRREQQIALQDQQLRIQAPKVEYHDKVLASQSTYNTTQIAKEFGWCAVTLNKKLQDLGIQYKQHGQWLLYAKYQGKGYTKTVTHCFTNSNGETSTEQRTVWTEAGRKFIHATLKA